MRRFLKIGCVSMVCAAALFAGLAFFALRHSLPPMPKLAGKIERGTLEQGGRRRTWIAYVPSKPAAHPALLIALHGSSKQGKTTILRNTCTDANALVYSSLCPHGPCTP